jgi:MerR, DNA binding
VRTLAVIETAQRAGLALDEIRLLLAVSPSDPAVVERLREVASRKLPEIIARIERAELVRGWLELAAHCECPDLGQCPLFGEPPTRPPPAGPRSPSARRRPNASSSPAAWPGPAGEPAAPGGARRRDLRRRAVPDAPVLRGWEYG